MVLRTLWVAGNSFEEITRQLNLITGHDIYTVDIVKWKWRRSYANQPEMVNKQPKRKITIHPKCPVLVRSLIDLVNNDPRSWLTIASLIGINYTALQRWQTGVSPRVDLLEDCFKFFGYSLTHIYTGDDMAPMVYTAEFKLLESLIKHERIKSDMVNDRALKEALADGYVFRIGDYVTISEEGMRRFDTLND
jgi:hypothetical protein